MSTTTQALTQIHEDRVKRKVEEARWERYRREANPPAWFAVVVGVTSLAGMIVFAEYLLEHPDALNSWIGILIGPFAGILSLGAWLSQRREKAIIRAIKEQAPMLFEKLREERVIR